MFSLAYDVLFMVVVTEQNEERNGVEEDGDVESLREITVGGDIVPRMEDKWHELCLKNNWI